MGEAATVTRSVTTSLAEALDPVPKALRESSAGGAFAGVVLAAVSVVAFIWGAAAGHWFSDDSPQATTGSQYDWISVQAAPRPDYAFLGWISALALATAIALGFRTLTRRSDREQRLAGRPAAERLWAQGWYCRRCGTVHFRVEPGVAACALTLREFQAMVWDAGGYGGAPSGDGSRPWSPGR
ncbi:hypothetical protein ABT095_27655 [Kitasatospora sp. NPDC002227]|uniref:hypothetical protein n=1 Tax=Kitasatospora sp. NPDC002227 TaxID=3154773 RepID=UPI003318A481